jgi:NitT/TauT family transport system permease protein
MKHPAEPTEKGMSARGIWDVSEAEPETIAPHPEKAEPRSSRILPYVAFVVAALAIWWPLTFVFEPFLPAPWEVATAFADAFLSGEIFTHLFISLRRVAFAWVVSSLLGIGIGIWMGRSWLTEAFLSPWIMVGLALPGPVIILFAVLLLGVQESSRLVALTVAVTPFVVNIVFEGVRSIDPGLEEMAKVYHWSRRSRMRNLLLPQIAGPIFAAVRFSFAFSWKIVLIVEALTTSEGIGGQLGFFFKLLRPDKVVAWTLVFTLIMLLVDQLVFRKTEEKVFAWRGESSD